MPRPYAPRPFYEPVIYFFSFCAGIICLASTLHSLVRSNGDVDVSTKAAKALGSESPAESSRDRLIGDLPSLRHR